MAKLLLFGLNTPTCLWIRDLLTERLQSVRAGNNTSNSITLSTSSPQGCVLSPLLFTLLTHDCASRHEGNQIIKFENDTIVVGLVHKNEKFMYREEVKHREDWCRENNLVFNVDTTKEMIMGFQRTQPEHTPLSISGRTVERVEIIKFLGVQILQDLSWNKTPQASWNGFRRDCTSWGSWNKSLSPSASSELSIVAWWRAFWHIASRHGRWTTI